jgi:hypothetical protein
VQVRHLRVGLKVAYWCNSPCGGADMFPATVVAVHPRTVTIEYLDHLAGPPVVLRENGRKVLVPPPPKPVRRRVFPEAIQPLEGWAKQGRRPCRLSRVRRRAASDK